MEALFEQANNDYGIKACVYAHINGFSVALRDVDAKETLPNIKIFPNFEKAKEYAKSLVA